MMNLRIRDKIFLILLALGMIFIVVGQFSGDNKTRPHPQKQLKVGNSQLTVEVADTSMAMAKGLSGRESLAEDQGMLFLHTQPGRQSYVMRDMRFPLDFVFILKNKVVDFAENVPADYQGTIQGATDYDWVLEVNSGWIVRQGIRLGDEISFL